MREILVGYKDKIEAAEELLEKNGIYTLKVNVSEAFNSKPSMIPYPLKSTPINYRLSIVYDQQFDDAIRLLKNPNHDVEVIISEKDHQQMLKYSLDTLTRYSLAIFISAVVLLFIVYVNFF